METTIEFDGEYIGHLTAFARKRKEFFKNTDSRAQFVGACGEFGVCEWLERNGIAIGADGAFPAFSWKEHQAESDIICAVGNAGRTVRIEIKTNERGNRRGRVKVADEEKIKKKADRVLWCEVELLNERHTWGEVDWNADDMPLPKRCVIRVLGWATAEAAFNAPREDEYRFMPEDQWCSAEDLIKDLKEQ